MTDYTGAIEDYIALEREALESLPKKDISRAMNILEKARKEGRRIFTCGNGGSASTASHMASDFNKGVSLGLDVKYDMECLSDNTAMLMAVANDIGYDDVFVMPLRNKLRAGDVLVGISGSGNSENVVRAFAYAKAQGATTIALTAYSGGRLRQMADCSVHVAVGNMQIAEDVHLALNHMMMHVLANAGVAESPAGKPPSVRQKEGSPAHGH